MGGLGETRTRNQRLDDAERRAAAADNIAAAHGVKAGRLQRPRTAHWRFVRFLDKPGGWPMSATCA